MTAVNEFDRLPSDIRNIVASFLPPETLSTSSSASRIFHKLMNNGTFWKLAADKLQLKNVTKENAKSQLLSLYGAINCLALSCLPEATQKKLSGIKDTFALHHELEKAMKEDPNALIKFQNANKRILDFIRPLRNLEELNKDPFLLNRKICVFVKESDDNPLKDFYALHFTTPTTLPLIRWFGKVGFFNNFPLESYGKAMHAILADMNMDTEELELFRDLMQAFMRNKEISEKEKKENIRVALAKPFHFEPSMRQWDACEIVVNLSGVAPPKELMDQLIKYFFTKKNLLFKNLFDLKETLETFKHLDHLLKFFIEKCDLSKDQVKGILKTEDEKAHIDALFDKMCYEYLTKLVDEIYKKKA